MRALAGLAGIGLAASGAAAHAASLPDTITTPKGLNLGSTSFFDGFGRQTPGFSFIEYDRYEFMRVPRRKRSDHRYPALPASLRCGSLEPPVLRPWRLAVAFVPPYL